MGRIQKDRDNSGKGWKDPVLKFCKVVSLLSEPLKRSKIKKNRQKAKESNTDD
jgi:hypothetical protein